MRTPRRLPVLFLPLLAMACATPAALVATKNDSPVTVGQAADDLAHADVVVLGELHETRAVHELHHALLEALYDRQPDLVIAMEMFERDVQGVVSQYLRGMIDEASFLTDSRPWHNYDPDYKPVIEFAKQHGLEVLAANAPTELAHKASKEGTAAVLGDPNVARQTTAPEDEYWDAFVEAMQGHGGTNGDGAMQRMYAAQCLKDDTMAESITDYLKRRHDHGEHPMVVLFCGRMHSDHGRGTVARIKSRMPGLDVRVLSAETVADLSKGVYDAPRSIGEYVVVAQEEPKAPPQSKPKAPAPQQKPLPPNHPPMTTKAAKPAVPEAAENPEGQRPGLGLMPDYTYAEGDGVRVAEVIEGGCAEKAGIVSGDVIRSLGGESVADLQSYVDVLGAQKIGKTITVRVRREGAEVDLQVLVGARSH